MKMQFVKDIKDGDHVNDLFVVSSVNKCTSDKAKTYLNITLQDNSGSISAKKWEVLPGDTDFIKTNNIIEVEGEVTDYKGSLQMKVLFARPIDISTVDLSDFKKVSPIPLKDMKAKLDKYLKSFKDPDVALITNKVIEHFYDKYITYPAAVKVHHEFGSGIIHHSLAMADLAEEVAKLYPQVDRDILVAGTLLHDIGKTIEYKDGPVPEQTVEGKLCGHISIMYAEFKRIVETLNIKSEVPMLLEHMILAHHGQLDFGSPVVPCTREAMLLSMIDLLDSKMMCLDKYLDATEPGEFTERIWSMDNASFYKPKERK